MVAFHLCLEELRFFMTMNRRALVTNAVAVAALATAVSAQASDAGACGLPGKNLFFTKENPGYWASKVGSHAPTLEVTGTKVKLKTPHSMSDDHFIVRHTLLLADGTLVGGKTFTASDTPVSDYDLPAGYKGKIYGTSFCNQHDFWLVEAVV
jgi:superoxide reductase